MASFVVLESRRDGSDDGIVAVKDGFVFLAFLIPLPWFLWHRMWIEALCALAVALAVSAIGSLSGFGVWTTIASILAGVFFGLEANSLRVTALKRRGWREWGVVEAETGEDAEIIYAKDRFGDESDDCAPAAISDPGAPRFVRPPRPEPPALGLIGYSGG